MLLYLIPLSSLLSPRCCSRRAFNIPSSQFVFFVPNSCIFFHSISETASISVLDSSNPQFNSSLSDFLLHFKSESVLLAFHSRTKHPPCLLSRLYCLYCLYRSYEADYYLYGAAQYWWTGSFQVSIS